jgi:nucleotide-binding universal stress UspA family protein
MFRNILISVDGSPNSDQALREAIDIAKAGNGRLAILTAVPKPASWATTPATAAVAESLAGELDHEFEQVLRQATSRVPDSIPVTKILTHESIRNALMHEIASGGYDLLVMGSRGRGVADCAQPPRERTRLRRRAEWQRRAWL